MKKGITRILDGFVITRVGLIPSRSYSTNKYEAPADKEVKLCQDWIAKFTKPSRQINPKAFSYSLKHRVEKWAKKYISNGAFISAALRSDYKAKPVRGGPNASFNMKFFFPEDEWKRVRPTGFSRWLFKKKSDETPIGDFARDAIAEKPWPRRAQCFWDFWEYLNDNNYQKDLDLLAKAWEMCYGQEPLRPDAEMSEKCETFYDNFYEGDCDCLNYGDSYEKAPAGMTYIYVLFDSKFDERFTIERPCVRYVGQTVNPSQRLRQHTTHPGTLKKVAWVGKLLNEGKYPRMGIVDVVPKEDALQMERAYMYVFADCERKVDEPRKDVLLNKW